VFSANRLLGVATSRKWGWTRLKARRIARPGRARGQWTSLPQGQTGFFSISCGRALLGRAEASLSAPPIQSRQLFFSSLPSTTSRVLVNTIQKSRDQTEREDPSHSLKHQPKQSLPYYTLSWQRASNPTNQSLAQSHPFSTSVERVKPSVLGTAPFSNRYPRSITLSCRTSPIMFSTAVAKAGLWAAFAVNAALAASSIPTISAVGSKFFYSNGTQYYIKGNPVVRPARREHRLTRRGQALHIS
jgi:S1-C subfamily serine protease